MQIEVPINRNEKLPYICRMKTSTQNEWNASENK